MACQVLVFLPHGSFVCGQRRGYCGLQVEPFWIYKCLQLFRDDARMLIADRRIFGHHKGHDLGNWLRDAKWFEWLDRLLGVPL